MTCIPALRDLLEVMPEMPTQSLRVSIQTEGPLAPPEDFEDWNVLSLTVRRAGVRAHAPPKI